jgi:hypothetical protein
VVDVGSGAAAEPRTAATATVTVTATVTAGVMTWTRPFRPTMVAVMAHAHFVAVMTANHRATVLRAVMVIVTVTVTVAVMVIAAVVAGAVAEVVAAVVGAAAAAAAAAAEVAGAATGAMAMGTMPMQSRSQTTMKSLRQWAGTFLIPHRRPTPTGTL